MDFFGQQASTRLRSRLLLLGFLFAYAGTGAVMYFGIALFSVQVGLIESVFAPSAPVAAVIGLFWLAILAGCFFRFLDVRAGGPALAKKFGAEAVVEGESSRYREDRGADRELLNVVAEVSVAASTPTPEVFVLRGERSINAFVLGTHQDKRALVVTQGALNAFERDELQAVVAHEFGHIAHGDLEVNMRLLVALGGLMALDEIGRMLIGPVTLMAMIRRTDDQHVHPGVFVGLVMRLFGSAGVLFGTLLRSAFSRQREFLADATAVQFTRAPFALASALNTVSEAGDDAPLHLHQAPELAHLCFSGRSVSHARNWFARVFTGWFATHPPLQSRIDAIDPHFVVKRRKLVKAARVAQREGDIGGMVAAASQAPVGPGLSPVTLMTATAAVVHASVSGAAANAAFNSAGPNAIPNAGPGAATTVAASNIPYLRAVTPAKPATQQAGLSDRIMLLLPDGRSCLAILFAFFVPDESLARREFLDEVAYCYEPEFSDLIQELLQLLPAELESDRLAIVEHATQVIKDALDMDKRQQALLTLETLVRRLGHEDLISYASLQLMRRKLAIEFPVVVSAQQEAGTCREARGSKVKTFEAMGEEFALMLSLMVEVSGAPERELDQQFKRVLSCYTGEDLPRRSSREPGIVQQLERAFQTLYVQPKSIRAAFVEHCAEIVLHDGRVTKREQSLIALFAASLGCEDVDLSPEHATSQAA
jgi:Zn-dependent protease with chaperone function